MMGWTFFRAVLLMLQTGYSTSFDGPDPQWTFQSSGAAPLPGEPAWNLDNDPIGAPGAAFRSSPASLNFNNGTSYVAPEGVPQSVGTATSPEIPLQTSTNLRLRFWCNYQTETDGTEADWRRVQISSDNFQTFLEDILLSTVGSTPKAGACAPMGIWHLHEISLESSWNQIQLRFSFDSGDNQANGFAGWFIDDLEVGENIGPIPPSYTPVINYTFDGNDPLNNWFLNSIDFLVGWGADGAPANVPGGAFRSAGNSLNYNNGTNYNTGSVNSGDAASPPIALAGLNNPVLSFWCNYQTETEGTDFDKRFVRVSNNEFQSLVLDEQLATIEGSGVAGNCSSMGLWHTHSIPLDSSWGTIRFRFLFDSIDASSNDFAGWFVDDVRLYGQVQPGGPWDPSALPPQSPSPSVPETSATSRSQASRPRTGSTHPHTGKNHVGYYCLVATPPQDPPVGPGGIAVALMIALVVRMWRRLFLDGGWYESRQADGCGHALCPVNPGHRSG